MAIHKAPVRGLVFAIRTGRSAIPVSAISLSQINLHSLHTKRTQQGIRKSREMHKLLTITISSLNYSALDSSFRIQSGHSR